MRLKEKVAIITGSAQGIGKEAALTFAQEGAKVIVCDVIEDAGRRTVKEIQERGGTALFVMCDVTRRDSVRHMVDQALREFGQIDILVNNAGILQDATLLKMTEDQWDAVINVNLKGVFNCTQAVAQIMVEQGFGKIINTSSVVGLYGNFGQTNYVATKSGIIGMTKVWAKELGRKGVNVNAVAPGFIATEMVKKMPEKILTMMKEKTPLNRLGQPRDVAHVYLFLASDESNFINGAVISVDGGVVL
ncbi:MAG: 3-oxoacyl-ACP reductase FabG [Gemmatimonadota bacterium]|nr:MAG: 3-oxoacyl-ACP reductase FabG [Gemmatimonadota bacterium]